jgi:hypothetical protein
MYRPSAVSSAIRRDAPLPAADPGDDVEVLVRMVIIAPARRAV